MYLEATLTLGSTGSADSLTRAAVTAALNADSHPQGARLGVVVKLSGFCTQADLDALLAPYTAEVSDLATTWIAS